MIHTVLTLFRTWPSTGDSSSELCMVQHRQASAGASADPRAYRVRGRGQGGCSTVGSMLVIGRCPTARAAPHGRSPQPNRPINAKRRGAGAVILDAMPTSRSCLAVACSRLIRTRAIPEDGAACALAPDVTGAPRVRANATADRLFDFGTWTPFRFKGLGCSKAWDVPRRRGAEIRRCTTADGGALLALDTAGASSSAA
jgi:hypothetical protein